jgi:hypothetical protein
MALTAYQTQVAALLQNPAAPTTLYTTAALTSAINIARGQIAGEGQCIRGMGTLGTTSGQQVYGFLNITPFVGGGVPLVGVQGALNVRQVASTTTGYLESQPFEYFFRYYGSLPAPASGPPTMWAQQGQGVKGSLWLYPVPATGTLPDLTMDCVCYPIPLVDDTTQEAIPWPWTDCVQYLAAYHALLAAQSGARSADSDRMFARYTEFSVRARVMSTTTVLPGDYQQSGRAPPGAGGG